MKNFPNLNFNFYKKFAIFTFLLATLGGALSCSYERIYAKFSSANKSIELKSDEEGDEIEVKLSFCYVSDEISPNDLVFRSKLDGSKIEVASARAAGDGKSFFFRLKSTDGTEEGANSFSLELTPTHLFSDANLTKRIRQRNNISIDTVGASVSVNDSEPSASLTDSSKINLKDTNESDWIEVQLRNIYIKDDFSDSFVTLRTAETIQTVSISSLEYIDNQHFKFKLKSDGNTITTQDGYSFTLTLTSSALFSDEGCTSSLTDDISVNIRESKIYYNKTPEVTIEISTGDESNQITLENSTKLDNEITLSISGDLGFSSAWAEVDKDVTEIFSVSLPDSATLGAVITKVEDGKITIRLSSDVELSDADTYTVQIDEEKLKATFDKDVIPTLSPESFDIIVKPGVVYTPLAFVPQDKTKAMTVSLKLSKAYTPSNKVYYYISETAPTNLKDKNWQEWTPSTSGTKVTIPAGNNMYIKGNGGLNGNSSNYMSFIFSAKADVEGDIGALLQDAEEEITTLSDYAFAYMFSGNNYLVNASKLELNYDVLSNYCYSSMFDACSSLTSAPSLPAEQLAKGCYSHMFRDCSSLKTPPTLSATKIEPYCYSEMFMGATSLKTCPELPAKQLAESCYSSMFEGCTSLTTTMSELPATKLAVRCYNSMFRFCTSLETIKFTTLPATEMASWCYYGMFARCPITKAPELPSTKLANNCYDEMFYYCTKLTTPPELPATNIPDEAYQRMFVSCYVLTTPPKILNINSLGKDSLYQMFYNCKKLKVQHSETVTTSEGSTLTGTEFFTCPYNLDIVNETRGGTNLSNNGYPFYQMFTGCYTTGGYYYSQNSNGSLDESYTDGGETKPYTYYYFNE